MQLKYGDESSGFYVGWSRGVESFDGRPDWNKGSYYANPLQDKQMYAAGLSSYAYVLAQIALRLNLQKTGEYMASLGILLWCTLVVDSHIVCSLDAEAMLHSIQNTLPPTFGQVKYPKWKFASKRWLA